MVKNKALKILGALSPQELKNFGIFLRRRDSRKETLIKLFNALRPYHPDFTAPQLDRHKLYDKVFPDQAFHQKRLLNEMADLRAAVEQFLIEQYLEHNTYRRNKILLQVYKNHHLDELFFSQLEKMEKAIDAKPETSYTWLEKTQLAEEFYYHPSTQRITDKAPEIHDTIKYLDHFYAIAKLQYACELFNRNNVLQDELNHIRLLDEVRTLPNIDTSVCFRAYALALELNEKHEEATYRELRTYFTDHFTQMQPKDQLIIFDYLINFASYEIKNGNLPFEQEVLALYRFGVENEFMIINGYFDIASFENIVAVFGKDKQFEWTWQFIKTWGAFLKPEIREDVVALSEAYVLFEQGKFDEAHHKVSQYKKLDIHHQIRAQVLRISCYVELEEYDSVYVREQCDYFARSVRRNKVISTATERSVLNFVKIVKLLYQPRLDKAALLTDLQKMKFIFSRKWLIEKVRAL